MEIGSTRSIDEVDLAQECEKPIAICISSLLMKTSEKKLFKFFENSNIVLHGITKTYCTREVTLGNLHLTNYT